MLVNQGVIGIKYWTGIDPDPKIMRQCWWPASLAPAHTTGVPARPDSLSVPDGSLSSSDILAASIGTVLGRRSQLRLEVGARLTEEFAGDGARSQDRLHEIPEVRGVLHERLGVLVPLEDDALGLVVIEVDLVLQRSGVLGPHDLHALSGQAHELLELALVELEPGDALKLTHCSSLQTRAWVDEG